MNDCIINFDHNRKGGKIYLNWLKSSEYYKILHKGSWSNFDVSDEGGLVKPQQYFFRKHKIKSFVLNVGIGQDVLIVSVQNPS